MSTLYLILFVFFYVIPAIYGLALSIVHLPRIILKRPPEMAWIICDTLLGPLIPVVNVFIARDYIMTGEFEWPLT